MNSIAYKVNDTSINFRTNSKIKKEATKILADFGLDLSTALNMLLRSVVRKRGIAVNGLTVNGYTPEYEAMILEASREAKASKTTYKNFDEMWASLDKKD